MTRPKPITDPHTGPSYQVVVSFRVQTTEDKSGDPDLIEAFVRNRLGRMKDLTVHIHKIGAGGETSEDEGRYDRPSADPAGLLAPRTFPELRGEDRPSALARTEDLDPDRPTRDIPPGDRL